MVVANATATTTVPLNIGSTLSIPPGALPEGTPVELNPLDISTLPPLPTPQAGSGTVFVAAAFSIDLSTGDDTQLNEPATFGFTLTAEQILALDGAQPEALFFNEDTGEWEAGGSTCDPAVEPVWNPPVLEVTVCHFSDWIVIGEQAQDAQVATPSPVDTGMGATESGATNTMAIVLGVVALAGILGAGSVALSRRRA